jgi:hypothetical protein
MRVSTAQCAVEEPIWEYAVSRRVGRAPRAHPILGSSCIRGGANPGVGGGPALLTMRRRLAAAGDGGPDSLQPASKFAEHTPGKRLGQPGIFDMRQTGTSTSRPLAGSARRARRGLGFLTRNQPVGRLNQGHRDPEPGVRLGQLHPDGPAAERDQGPGCSGLLTASRLLHHGLSARPVDRGGPGEVWWPRPAPSARG